MSHQALVEAAAASASQRSVEPFLPKNLSDRRRSAVAKAVARGLAISPEQYPKPLRPQGRRPSEAERRRFLELQKRRDARAAQLDIDPTLIASRATLSDLAHHWEKHADDLMNWQRDLLAG